MTTSLIIPAYNEAERLGSFLSAIADFVATNPELIHQIIVVDDGSADNTGALAESYYSRLPKLKVIKHAHNRGKGAAVQTGVLSASGDHIVFMDADGATKITELPKMLRALATADVAIGNRWMKGARTHRTSALRQLSGFLYRSYMSVFGLGKIDTMCGFKGYQKKVAIELFTHLHNERWLFDTEVAYKAIQRDYSIHNFPINWQSMDGSKLDTRTLLKSAFQIWPLIRKLKADS
jgi:dolichyl-phosphate beta-glucosyltransferase